MKPSFTLVALVILPDGKATVCYYGPLALFVPIAAAGLGGVQWDER